MEALANITYRVASQLCATYDPIPRSLCLRWNPTPRPCYNPKLLEDFLTCCHQLQERGNVLPETFGACPVEYVILASARPGVFMLGGDLELFAQAIERQDRETLRRYGRICVDIVHSLFNNFAQPLTTIALVEGACLGGGFEAALTCDLIIAERQARFGFPEIRFNLFPGMGAVSLLERRIGRISAMRLLEGGALYSADEMYDMGVVDVVVRFPSPSSLESGIC